MKANAAQQQHSATSGSSTAASDVPRPIRWASASPIT